MYFSFTEKKLTVVFLASIILCLAVLGTMFKKTELYGDSKFNQVFFRILSSEYRAFRYTLRRDKHSATGLFALTEAKARPLPRTTNTRAEAIPVLTYHAIISPPDKADFAPESFEGHNVELKAFEEQMFALHENGWKSITLDEFDEFMRGTRTLPARSFLLTFDDGAKDSYYPVDPLLRVLGFNGASFIIPTYSEGVGTYYYLSKNEISRALASGRWEIGSHSNSHQFVAVDAEGKQGAELANRQWNELEGRPETMQEFEARVQRDLKDSKTKLQHVFNRSVNAFAFPFGEYGQINSNVAGAEDFIIKTARNIYDYSFYQWYSGEGFTYNYPVDHPAMIKRISVPPSWSGLELVSELEKGLPKSIPFKDTFNEQLGWIPIWATTTLGQGKLHLAAAPDASGAAVILDGTKAWTDYAAHFEVESPTQTGVAILLRFKDNDNSAVCNLGNGFAHVEQTVNGIKRVIKGNRSPAFAIPSGPYTIDVIVAKRSVSCAVNGKKLVDTTFLDPSLAYGGIGIKVWDRELGKSSLYVDKLTVTAPNANRVYKNTAQMLTYEFDMK